MTLDFQFQWNLFWTTKNSIAWYFSSSKDEMEIKFIMSENSVLCVLKDLLHEIEEDIFSEYDKKEQTKRLLLNQA